MKRMIAVLSLISALSLTSFSNFANADAPDTDPSCLDRGNDLPVNNQQVLTWKTTTANQFLARAHVQGTIKTIYPDRNGHKHFDIQIGPNGTDTIEIVFNLSFGSFDVLAPGQNVEACGDYITSNAATAQYQASPDGAILHWVHKNPKPKGHESGYVEVDNKVYGY